MCRCLTILFALAAAIGLAQSPQVLGKRVDTPPVIDGIIHEDEWKDAATWTKFVEAINGAESTESTQVWLAYDSQFIYFAARATEVANQITANEYRINSSLRAEDHIELQIDFSGTMADFNTFGVNPRGATSIQLAGGRALKREWLGEFVALANRTATGYEVEAKIPWSIMKIGSKGRRNLRFNFNRYHAHNQHTQSMAFTGNNLVDNTPTWVGVEIPRVKEPRILKLLPYAYGGYDKDSGKIANAGLDLKAPITDKVEFVGSINPDFKNVENNILSLDFSRFERLAGEVRPFFLEGSDYLNTGIFSSQRIRTFSVGTKAYGRIDDKTTFGYLDTWRPGEKNQVLVTTTNTSPNDQIRFSFAGTDRAGLKNDAYLLRYSGQRGPWSLFARQLMSQDSQLGKGKDDNVTLGFSQNPWSAFLAYIYSEPSVAVRLGFLPETDYKGTSLSLSHDAQSLHGRLDSYGFGGNLIDYKHIDGSFYRNERLAFAYFNDRVTKLGGQITIDNNDFEGQKDTTYNPSINYPYNNAFRNFNLGYTVGTAQTDPYRSLNFGAKYRTLKDKLDLGLVTQFVHFQGYAEQIIFSMNYDLGNDMSLSGRVVKANNLIGPYVAFRRAGNRGMEYFVLIGDPNSPQFRTALTLKVTIPYETKL